MKSESRVLGVGEVWGVGGKSKLVIGNLVFDRLLRGDNDNKSNYSSSPSPRNDNQEIKIHY